MKKARKEAKLKSFKNRFNQRYYLKAPFEISIEDFSEERLANIFYLCCAIYKTNRIAVEIGNFKNDRASVYVWKLRK